MATQYEKGLIFQALHNLKNESFIMPNAWDAGTSKIITACGFAALASSSAAFALSKGVLDNSLSLTHTLENLSELASATSLPVSADFGYGFTDNPEIIYNNIQSLMKTGVVGASIEDVQNSKIYPLEIAKEKIIAAVNASKEMNFTFTLTARADNFFIGKTDLKDTIIRLQEFQDAGADVLFAPGLTTEEQIKTVLSNIDKPLNVLIGLPNFELSIAELKELGVKRISMGATLAKLSFTSVINSLEAIKSNNESILKDSLTMTQLIKMINLNKEND